MDRNEWTERERMYACWLCNFPGIGNRQMHQLTEICGCAEAVYFADKEIWGRVLSPKQTESLKAYTAAWKPEEEYGKMKAEGIELVTIGDMDYPERLKEIPDAPYGLFYRGRLPEKESPAIAVIGARECSEYGKYVARQLGKLLAGNGIVLVSGMAKGIDGISQGAALEAGGYSVGVLGSGVDVCYPAQNRALYERLVETGGVISSYPIGTQALGRNFPPRNRIVSGMADMVVVIEARAKSGTLITVDMALEQGREVYVVPGRVTDRLSDGCNRLIKQGAGVVLELEEFLEEIRELQERRRSREGSVEVRERRSREGSGEVQERRNREGSVEVRERRSREGSVEVRERRSREGSGEVQERRSREGSGEVQKRKREESVKLQEDNLLQEISGELAAVYQILDFTPKSAGQIQGELSDEYGANLVTAALMQLVMRKYAVQVSPGHFCRRGN